MGLVLLRNARFPLLALQIDATLDFGVLHLCIPQRVCDRLQLERITEKDRLPYVGPIEIRFAASAAFTGALVTGDQVVLGTIALQALELAQ
jgi:hypothetical protein